MRRILLIGLAAGLAAPVSTRAQPPVPPAPAEESPPRGEAPRPPVTLPEERSERPAPDPAKAPAPAPSEDRGPQPGEAPPLVSPWGDRLRPDEPAKAKPKPKLDEAAGGVAGSLAGKVAGTAIAGPVGGIAASLVGGPLGSATVRTGKKVLGIGKKRWAPAEQAQAEPAPAPEAPDTTVRPQA